MDAGPFTQVAAGDVHSAAVAVDGSIWMWGRGTRGALGLGGNMKNALVPEQVMSLRVAFTCCDIHLVDQWAEVFSRCFAP